MARRSSFRNILCPIDFSSGSREAVRYGAELARRANGTLTILFVNDPLLGPAAAAAGYDLHALEANTTAELRRFVKRILGAGASSATLATAYGHAVPEILKAARRVEADLIVMGSRGLTAPAKWFSGSTTERVLRKTAVPVLVVPAVRGSAHRKPLGAWPGGRVLIPIDVADASAADVRAAIAAATGLGSTPVLLHVLEESALPPWLTVERNQTDRARTQKSRDALKRLLGRAPGTIEVAIGRPSDQIVAMAAQKKAGLVVMTLKRSPSRFGPRRGVVTYQVLCRDAAPVLALPGH